MPLLLSSDTCPLTGLDSTKAHTQRSAARRSGAIFDQLKAPSGSCAQLALSTNGSVFDVTHMQGRSRIQSEFMESFATRGAVGAVSPSCEVCSCHDDGSGRGHTVCRLCTSGSWLWNVSGTVLVTSAKWSVYMITPCSLTGVQCEWDCRGN